WRCAAAAARDPSALRAVGVNASKRPSRRSACAGTPLTGAGEGLRKERRSLQPVAPLALLVPGAQLRERASSPLRRTGSSWFGSLGFGLATGRRPGYVGRRTERERQARLVASATSC